MIRADGALKVAGAADFGPDLEAPGMLWAALVPSPVAHGRILSLDLASARRRPGVAAAIGPEEVQALIGPGGDAERPLFPVSEVSYLGQPVAAVAASTLAAARAAVRSVSVKCEPLPAVLEIEDVFPEWPGSDVNADPRVVTHVHARHGDIADAVRTAEFVHRETYRTSGVHQMALEPHACLARVDGGVWRVATSTQSPFGAREDAASILGIPEKQLVIEGTWVGGGFGGKGAAFVEPYALALAAATDRPVKLSLSYREEFTLGRTTLPAVVRMETAVSGGKMVGRRVQLLLDTGSSLPGRDFATGYALAFVLGPYRTDCFDMEGYAIRTNKPPFGPHRAPFAPQCAFVADGHIDGIARRLGVDPLEFRLQNAWREGDQTPLGQTVGPFGLVACLERARATINAWRQDSPSGNGIAAGVGFWSTFTAAGGEATVFLTPQGLIIEQGEREIGSGSVIRGLVAVVERVTGLPSEAIRVESADTAHAPFDSGVYGSRTVGALGRAVEQATREALSILAARQSGRPPTELDWKDGRLHVRYDGRRQSLESVLTPEERAAGGLRTAGRHYGVGGAIDERRVVTGGFSAYGDFTAAVHAAEVAVDRQTGAVRVVRYAAFQDVGVALDAEMVRGQTEGGVAMGLGAALTEETMWSPEGRIVNAGLLDYRVPTLGEVPPIEVVPIEGFPGAGPFGAKGMGEPPIIPVAAAVGNAVADATGARVTELPMTPERVARALKII